MFSVETAGIALGLSLALGIFAFKSAVGEYYFCSIPSSRLHKAGFIFLTLGLYTGIFVLAFYILERIDLFRLAGDSVGFLKTGVMLHLLLCIGLLIWGIRLLCRRSGETLGKLDSKGWFLLAIPCPVCASAIFLVCAFTAMLFPQTVGMLRWIVPAFFLLANLVFLLMIWGIGKIFTIHPLALTGRLMILIALYFILILLIAPQFQDAEKLYAAACATGTSDAFSWPLVVVLTLLGLAGISGFMWNFLPRKGS